MRKRQMCGGGKARGRGCTGGSGGGDESDNKNTAAPKKLVFVDYSN